MAPKPPASRDMSTPQPVLELKCRKQIVRANNKCPCASPWQVAQGPLMVSFQTCIWSGMASVQEIKTAILLPDHQSGPSCRPSRAPGSSLIHGDEKRMLPAALPSLQLTFQGYKQLRIFPLMDRLHVLVPPFFPKLF